MKSNAKFEAYVYKVIEKYSKILLLDKHRFELRGVLENENALMECKFSYPYLLVILNYGQEVVNRWKHKKDIVPIIVHELCHPITDPLYAKACSIWKSKDEVEDEREKLTDYITNIVIKNNL